MLSKFVKGKVAVFIDAENLFYSERTLGWRIDFQKLAQRVVGKESKHILRYYTGIFKREEKQQAFLRKLESFGYFVVAKEVKVIRLSNGAMIAKGNLDVELALDACLLRDHYDTCVLFSGDSDFAYLFDVLKKEGKHLIVISSRGHISKELVNRARYIALPKLRMFIERNPIIKGPDKPAPEVR